MSTLAYLSTLEWDRQSGYYDGLWIGQEYGGDEVYIEIEESTIGGVK